MTIDDLRAQGGYKVVGYATSIHPPTQKTFTEKLGGAVNAVFPGKQIGTSVTKGLGNLQNLASGGRSKYESGLAGNEAVGGRVDVPAAIGDYVQAGIGLGGAALPIARAQGVIRGGTSGRGAASFVEPATRGAKAVALGKNVAGGAGLGYTSDVGGNLSSGSKDASIFKLGLGTAVGALGGGAVSALTRSARNIEEVPGEIGAAISARRAGSSTSKKGFAEDFVSPKETAKVKAEAIEQGRLQAPGLLRPARIEASSRDTRVADAVRDVISPKASLAKNIDAIRSKLSTTNNGVKTYIDENKVPFNVNQLRTRLVAAKKDSQLVFASDATAERTYDAVVNEFLKHVAKKDTGGLFAARQEFDKIPAIKKLLDSRALGENVKKSIVLDVRRAANEYVADLLPENNRYRELLLQESHMLEAIGNAAEKGAATIGKNNIQLLTEKYPILKWIAGGLVGAGGVGVGSTVIGSSD